MNEGARWLIAGGIASLLASLAHVACLIFGATWFRFFGAPEALVVDYENGGMQLVWTTIAIAVILAIWAGYAFSGAGKMAKLPLLRTGLIVIAGIYLLRGVLLFPAIAMAPYPRSDFDIWSSAIVLAIGIAYAVGTWRAWPALTAPRSAA